MTDSSNITITYKAIRERAAQVAQEYMPDFPKESTFESWVSFQRDVESLDAFEIAHESCEWDWVVYYHRAMELCQAVPSDVLHDVELEYADLFSTVDPDQFGLYEFAFRLAAIIVTREIEEAVESLKEEMIDLAETQLDNL